MYLLFFSGNVELIIHLELLCRSEWGCAVWKAFYLVSSNKEEDRLLSHTITLSRAPRHVVFVFSPFRSGVQPYPWSMRLFLLCCSSEKSSAASLVNADDFWVWLQFVLPRSVPSEVTAYLFTSSQLRHSAEGSLILSPLSISWPLWAFFDRDETGVMNNATGRLFLKASHKASAFSGILLEHEKRWSCAAVDQRRRGGSTDWGKDTEREREGGGGGRASSGIHLLQGREMSCEVKVEMGRLLYE